MYSFSLYFCPLNGMTRLFLNGSAVKIKTDATFFIYKIDVVWIYMHRSLSLNILNPSTYIHTFIHWPSNFTTRPSNTQIKA